MEVSKVSNYESYNFNGLVFSHLGSKSKVLMGKFIAIEKKKIKISIESDLVFKFSCKWMGITLRVWFLSLQIIKFIIYKSLSEMWSHHNFLSSQKWYFKTPPQEWTMHQAKVMIFKWIIVKFNFVWLHSTSSPTISQMFPKQHFTNPCDWTLGVNICLTRCWTPPSIENQVHHCLTWCDTFATTCFSQLGIA